MKSTAELNRSIESRKDYLSKTVEDGLYPRVMLAFRMEMAYILTVAYAISRAVMYPFKYHKYAVYERVAKTYMKKTREH